MSALIKYEAACRALAECKSVDEVKSWSDKSAAMQAYQRMAGDKSLETDAAEIRIRAERRLGELLLLQKQTVGLNSGARVSGNKPGAGKAQPAVVTDDRRLRLADVGISKDLSSRSQKLAAVPDEEFEEAIGEWRESVKAEGARVTARLEKVGARELKKNAEKIEKTATDDDDDDGLASDAEIAAVVAHEQAQIDAMLRIAESDDKLKQALAENQLLLARTRAADAARDTAQSQAAHFQAEVRKWRRRAERAEKQLKQLESA